MNRLFLWKPTEIHVLWPKIEQIFLLLWKPTPLNRHIFVPKKNSWSYSSNLINPRSLYQKNFLVIFEQPTEFRIIWDVFPRNRGYKSPQNSAQLISRAQEYSENLIFNVYIKYLDSFQRKYRNFHEMTKPLKLEHASHIMREGIAQKPVYLFLAQDVRQFHCFCSDARSALRYFLANLARLSK